MISPSGSVSAHTHLCWVWCMHGSQWTSPGALMLLWLNVVVPYCMVSGFVLQYSKLLMHGYTHLMRWWQYKQCPPSPLQCIMPLCKKGGVILTVSPKGPTWTHRSRIAQHDGHHQPRCCEHRHLYTDEGMASGIRELMHTAWVTAQSS